MSSWEIVWSYPAAWMLRAIPWRQAARVDAAVQRFAQTGAGDIERIGESMRFLRLHVLPFMLHLEVNADEGILRVWSLSRSRKIKIAKR